HGEEYHALALEDLAHGHVLRSAVAHLLELQVEGQRVACFDRHAVLLPAAGGRCLAAAGCGRNPCAPAPSGPICHAWRLTGDPHDHARPAPTPPPPPP